MSEREEEVSCPICGQDAVVIWSGTPDGEDPRREDAVRLDCPTGHELTDTQVSELFPRIVHRRPV
jgi:hypothetical protein